MQSFSYDVMYVVKLRSTKFVCLWGGGHQDLLRLAEQQKYVSDISRDIYIIIHIMQ